MIKPGFKEAAEAFVQKGGTFITTYFSGIINETVGVFLRGYPGPLKEVTGVKVEEYDPLPPGKKNIIKLRTPLDGFKKEYSCEIWCDVIHTAGAEVLASFANDYYADYPCITENHFGDGKAYYVGTRPDKDFMKDFLTKILKDQGIGPPNLPEGVELMTRSKNGRSYYFYLNHGETEKEIKLANGKYENILTGTTHEGNLNLGKYAVSILRKK
jgi:beta-galactosidase